MTGSLLQRWRQEQDAARQAGDPNASLIVLATVSPAGQPEARTLVLRWVEHEPALFVNRTSPKWQSIEAEPRVALLAYWPSLEIQYRIDGQVEPLADAVVHGSWRARPAIPRQLDQLYESFVPQSGVLADPAVLEMRLEDTSPDPAQVPAAASGLLLRPERIERLKLQSNAPHERSQAHVSSDWAEEYLMP